MGGYNNFQSTPTIEEKLDMLSQIGKHFNDVATKVETPELDKFYSEKQTLGKGTKMEKKIETLVSTTLSVNKDLLRKNELAESDHIRELLSVMNVLFVVVTSISYAAFWTNASRLYTDPAIIVGIKDYDCSNSSTVSSSTFTTISEITAQSMIFDFIKSYICIMIVPTTFLWYSYYTEDSGTRRLKNDAKSKFAYISLWVLLVLAVVLSMASLAMFGVSMNDYNYCGSKTTQQKGGLGVGLLGCALVSFCVWSGSIFLRWFFIQNTEKDPNEKQTLWSGLQTLFCACCIYGPKNMCCDLCCISCCSSKRVKYFGK